MQCVYECGLALIKGIYVLLDGGLGILHLKVRGGGWSDKGAGGRGLGV